MPTKTERNPKDTNFNKIKVSDPIDGSDVRDFTDSISFLEGYSVAKVATANIPFLFSPVTITSGTLYPQYWKTPGAKVVLIEVEKPLNLLTSNSVDKSAYCDITPPTGATWIGLSPFDSTVAQNTREYFYVNTGSLARPILRGYLDVSSVASSSISSFTCSFTEVTNSLSSSKGYGATSTVITELPRAFVYTSSSDIGLESTWTSAIQKGELVDGTATSGFGFKRLVKELDRCRAEVRSQQNLSVLFDSGENYSWRREYSATSGSLTYGTNTWNVDSSNRHFFLRAKNLYGTGATTAPYAIRVTYRTQDSDGTHKLVLKYRAYGSGAPFSMVEINCPPSTTVANVDQSINLPTTGTDGEVEFFFEASVTTDSPDVLFIYNIFIAENFS